MCVISSINNSKIQHIKKLESKKYRTLYGQYIAEGTRWISDAIKVKSFSNVIDSVYVASGQCNELESLLATLANFVKEENIFIVSDAVFDKVAPSESSQGILAILNVEVTSDLPRNGMAIFLDRVRDPGNMGTLIRTAIASGYENFVLYDCVDIYNPKTVRSTMSAILKPKFFVTTDCKNAINTLKSTGYEVLGGDMNGKNIFNYEHNHTKICLVLGSEADGISSEIKSVLSDIVSIPMKDMESLNVAVSGGILMYQLNQKNIK